MKISAAGQLAAAEAARSAYQPPALSGTAAQAAQKSDYLRRFDSVTLTNSGAHTNFELELRSKLSQEVRTATSSGAVSKLRDEVRSGAYRPDTMMTARKMLLWGEAV